ncbi:MAG: FkbM family methyltransferase [Parvularculaceae bacterium]
MLKRFFHRDNASVLTHDGALARIAQKQLEIATIIDVGAAKGAWTEKAWRHWPQANAHLLEAKESWRPDIENLRKKHGRVSYKIAGAARTPGKIYFPKDVDEYGGAVFKESSERANLEEIDATSIDHEVAQFGLKGPYAIKLDTHGTEVDILDGATRALEETAFLCIETYSMIGQKRFPELIADLQGRGFRCADVAEPLFRPRDKLLWQIDFYFLRADHPAFRDYKYLP